MKNLESRNIYFYYVPKKSGKRMRVEFSLDYLKMREDYFLAGIFIPGKIFRIPRKGYFKFKESEMSYIEGEFFSFKIPKKTDLNWFLNERDALSQGNV